MTASYPTATAWSARDIAKSGFVAGCAYLLGMLSVEFAVDRAPKTLKGLQQHFYCVLLDDAVAAPGLLRIWIPVAVTGMALLYLTYADACSSSADMSSASSSSTGTTKRENKSASRKSSESSPSMRERTPKKRSSSAAPSSTAKGTSSLRFSISATNAIQEFSLQKTWRNLACIAIFSLPGLNRLAVSLDTAHRFCATGSDLSAEEVAEQMYISHAILFLCIGLALVLQLLI
ncbi:unnamed protein product [Amoebophrya sp. A25]|nr:unnamed protein product [Amoebophrya sp. A25]|eukprot:GSA25T00015992001.1